jgi:hypothetical protein
MLGPQGELSEVVGPLAGGPGGRSLGPQRVPLKGIVGPLSLSRVCSLANEGSSFLSHKLYDVLPSPEAPSNGASGSSSGTSRAMSENNSFLFIS